MKAVDESFSHLINAKSTTQLPCQMQMPWECGQAGLSFSFICMVFLLAAILVEDLLQNTVWGHFVKVNIFLFYPYDFHNLI